MDDFRINKSRKLIQYYSYHWVFGSTGSGEKNYGVNCYGVGRFISIVKTYELKCTITHEGCRLADGTELDLDLRVRKRGTDFRNFNQGKMDEVISLVDKLREMWEQNFPTNSNFDRHLFLNTISSIKQKDCEQELKLDDGWSDKIKMMPKFPLKRFGKLDLSQPKGKTFKDYIEEFDGNSSPNNIVHIPMLLVERGDCDIPEITSFPIPEAKIASNAYNVQFEESRSYEELEIDSYFNQGTKKHVKASNKMPDVIHCDSFTSEDLRLLANRGVLGKENDDLKDLKSKKLSWNADLTILDDYLNEPLEMNNFDSIDDKDLNLLSSSISKTTEFIADHVIMLSSFELYEPLRFLDAALSEAIYNAQRNPRSNDEFIIRKIQGYKAFVMIRNTRLGTVHSPSPCFYSILFKGKSYGPSGLFEESYEVSDEWKCTRFLSTDRTRSSHTMNLWEQCMQIFFENIECLGSLTEKPNEDMVRSVSKAIKYDLLLLLSDSAEYSSVIHNLRFYYFALLTGLKGCKSEAEHICSKFPTAIRNPLLLHSIRGVIDLHDNLDEGELIRASRHLTPRRILERLNDDNRGSDYGADDLESDTLPTIPTPFGFNIVNTRTFLKASYKQIYHNKDESDRGPASKQIVSKIFKTEKRMRERLNQGKPVCIESDVMDDNGEIYQCHLNAILFGADLVRKELIDLHGGSLKRDLRSSDIVFDEWIMNTTILPAIIRTTYSELASTKSSFKSRGKISLKKVLKEKQSLEELEIGETMKCIEAVYNFTESDDVKGTGPAHDLELLLERFDEEDEGIIVVKIFKKNQNTGVRDIYILTILGRMMIRICEDISRSFCRKLPFEKLTSPSTRDRFMSDHYAEVKSYMKAENISGEGMVSHTFKESGDMSEWANRWFMKSISAPLLRLTPKCLHPFIMKVMNSITNKLIELPRQFIKSAVRNPGSELWNEMADLIKRELIGQIETKEFVEEDGIRVSCLANMMQGILHYTSSLAHTSSILLFKKIMKEVLMKLEGLHVVMSFECSSDDKGILMTIISEKSKQLNLNRIKEIWRMVSSNVDSAYGLKTSMEKTNLTVTSLFEFNSVFYCGNSISVPLAKFTTRCLDDSVQSSLHQRVSGLYSSLRQVRENGGSGILCSLLSYCQRSVLMNNLGWRTMSWFDDSVLEMFNKFKFSYLGHRQVVSPITAGICMAEYENLKFAHDNSKWAQLKRLSMNEFSDSEFILRDNMEFGMWERDKHARFMRRLRLEKSEEMSEDELRIRITGGKTKEEMRQFMKYVMSSKGFGRSLAMVQRSDIARASVYLLWSQIFFLDGVRSSISDVVDSLTKMPDESPDVPPEYKKWFVIEEMKRSYSFRLSRSRLRPRKYEPLIRIGVTRDEIVNVIKEDWYGVETDHDEDYEIIRESVYEIEWIRKSPQDTFSVVSPMQFMMLLNGIPNKFNKVKLLARGPSHSGDTIEALMRENCCADMIMTLDSDDRTDDFASDIKVVNALSHRISGWCDILYEESNDEILKTCFEDIKRHSKELKTNSPVLVGGIEDNKIGYLTSAMKEDNIDLKKMFTLLGRRDMWIKNQDLNEDGDPVGEGVLLKFWRKSILILIRDGYSYEKVIATDINVAKDFAQIIGCENYSDNYPSLTIKPKIVRFHQGGITISDGTFETFKIFGTSRSGVADIFEQTSLLDQFLSATTKEFNIDKLMDVDDDSDCILYAIGMYLNKSKYKPIVPSSEPNRPFRSRRKTESEPEIVFDEIETMMDELMDADVEAEWDFDDVMGMVDDNDIPDWTIAGTETMKLRKKTGWERNEATRRLIDILRLISVNSRNNRIFATEMLDLHERIMTLTS